MYMAPQSMALSLDVRSNNRYQLVGVLGPLTSSHESSTIDETFGRKYLKISFEHETFTEH